MQADFVWVLTCWMLGGLASGWLVGAYRGRSGTRG
jgi:hypothetical protein